MSHKLTAKQVKSTHFMVCGDNASEISRAMKFIIKAEENLSIYTGI